MPPRPPRWSRLTGLIAAATLGGGALVGTGATTAHAAPAAPEVAVPVADVLDVDFRDGTTADHARAVSPRNLGQPRLVGDLDRGRTSLTVDGDDAVAYDIRDAYPSLAGGFSLECSFRYDGARTAASGEASVCSNKNSGGFATVVVGTNVRFMAHLGGAYRQIDAPIRTGEWVHTVGTWDGTAAHFYVNGTLVGSVDAAAPLRTPAGGARSLLLGADSNASDGGEFWSLATIRGARIFGDALSLEQVQALQAAEQTSPVAPVADVLDVDFADGTPADAAQAIAPRTFGEPRIGTHAPLGKQVATFDGTSAAYLYPFEEQFPKLRSALTVECFFKYDADFQAGREESRGNVCGAKESGGFSITMYGNNLSFNPYVGGSYRSTETVIEPGRWYHVVGSWDGTTSRLYVDGTLAAERAAAGTLGTPTAGARNFVVGGDAAARNLPQFYSPSTVSAARVFSRGLTASEVLALGHHAYAGRPNDYRPGVLSSTPADGGVLTRATRFEVELRNPEALGYDVAYTLDGDEIRPGQRIGVGMKAGQHVIRISGHDVFGGLVDETIEFTSADIPSPGGTQTDQGAGSATLSAIATNPSGRDVTTTFSEARVVVAEGGRQGVLADLPTTRDFTGRTEEPVTDALRPGDGSLLESPATDGIPFQQLDVPAADVADQQLIWTGVVDPAREAVLRAWNGQAWEELGRTRGNAQGEVRLVAEVTARHRHQGVVPVLVTGEDPFADDLENPVRDAFEDPDDYDFALAHLTDTQYLVEGAVEQETQAERDTWRRAYEDTARWIAANWKDRKIAYAAHTGDIIENWHNATDNEANARKEYEVASAAQKIIEDSGIPNGTLPGNHDNVYGADNGLYNEYFPASRYQAQATQQTWQDAQVSYHPWKADDNSNHYSLMTAGGLDFVIVALGFGVSAEEAAWADGVLQQYADRNAIVLTHAYITPSSNPDGRGGGFSYDGRQVLDGVIRGNPNVALVLSGHEHGVNIELRRDVGRTGNHVVELLADYQFYKVTAGELGLTEVGGYQPSTPLQFGAAFFRMLQFDVDRGEVAVDTYSPFLNNFGATEYDDRRRYNGMEDDTRLPIQLETRRTSVATDSLVVVEPTDTVIGTDTARSGWPTSVTWSGLEAGRTYGWYAVSRDARTGEPIEAGEVGQLSLFTAEATDPGTDPGTDPEPGPGPGPGPVAPGDTVAPRLQVPAGGRVVAGGSFDPLAGVTAVDDVDGDVLASIQVVGAVDTTVPGRYALTYVVRDRAGNQAVASRVVDVVAPPAPVNRVAPTVGGSPRVGGVLTADVGGWDNVDGVVFEVQWLRDGAPVPGATGSDYRVGAADAGARLAVRVTATVPGRDAVTAASTGTAVKRYRPTVALKLVKAAVRPGQRAKAVVVVAAPDLRINGRLLVRVGDRVVTARAGGSDRSRVVVRLPKMPRGAHRVVAVFDGSDVLTSARSGVQRLKVRR